VVFPSFGESMCSGQVTRWLKAAGEHVEAGEPLVEVESEKASVEMLAPASGILGDVLVPPGRDVQAGTAIAAILSVDLDAAMTPGPHDG
jgi:pyruvate/2-oxoglutarate dehydrogenase complex dihydrolipoamide acyltransferase (E2) component